MIGSGHFFYLHFKTPSQNMSEQDMFLGFVKDIIKPIVVEAYREAIAEEKAHPQQRFYTREETCRLLNIGTTTFYRLAKKGKLQILKIEGKTLVDAETLDQAIDNRSIFRYQR